ncbi:hypothetical protein BC567DRAFT_267839 [Phyllosticta citribraziliensis]
MSSNPPPENHLQAILRQLKFNSLEELKQEYILKPSFLGPWKHFRDNVIWDPKSPGCERQKLESVVDKIVREIDKREMSTYVALEDEHIDISDYTVQDHLIRLVVSVAVATKRARSVVQVEGSEDTTRRFARGIIALAKELGYQYLPAVRGYLAKEVDKATGPSIHKNAQAILHNLDGVDEENSRIFSAALRDLQIQRGIGEDEMDFTPWDLLAANVQRPELDSRKSNLDDHASSGLTTLEAPDEPNSTRYHAARPPSGAACGNVAEGKDLATVKKQSLEDYRQGLLKDLDDCKKDFEAVRSGELPKIELEGALEIYQDVRGRLPGAIWPRRLSRALP